MILAPVKPARTRLCAYRQLVEVAQDDLLKSVKSELI